MAALPLAREYKTKSYWEQRFKAEAHYEWLASWEQVRHLLMPFLGPLSSRVLILGNGTSLLPLELAAEGFHSVTATDYVSEVVDAMRARHPGAPVAWAVADMTALPASGFGAVFDVVLDKGAMDALVSAEGDSWSPPPEALAVSRSVCEGVAGLLAPGGRFLQISFSQPHFRAAHLLQKVVRGGGALEPALPPPPAPPPPANGDEDFEPDLNPGAEKPLAPSVAGSLWSDFEVLAVPAGIGYFCYVCTKAL